MNPTTFDRSQLSAREAAVFDLAIEGLTDIQIALRLDISPSTVNSYWVRIRGKLGQFSRTELVALALKHQAHTDMEAANARIAILQRQAEVAADYENVEIYRAALDAMPEATLVCCQQAIVRYANARLETMFGYDEGELIGQPVLKLVPMALREVEDGRIAGYVRDPHPLRVGVGSVVYGQRRNGTQFRMVLLIDSRPTSTGSIFTCIVRDFAHEVEMRRHHASGWSI